MRATRFLTVLSFATAMPFWTGCAVESREVTHVRARYQFENVRASNGFDEWKYISGVLQRYAEGKVEAEPKNLRTVGRINVHDYTAELTARKLTDLNLIHRDLYALAKRNFGKEKIEFKLLTATALLEYRSNYIVAELEIILRGQTDPSADVTVFLHSGGKTELATDRSGRWSVQFKVGPSRRYIYGYAVDARTSVRKFFRIDIFSQVQEDVAADLFDQTRVQEP